jgi:hypothetical protein
MAKNMPRISRDVPGRERNRTRLKAPGHRHAGPQVAVHQHDDHLHERREQRERDEEIAGGRSLPAEDPGNGRSQQKCHKNADQFRTYVHGAFDLSEYAVKHFLPAFH